MARFERVDLAAMDWEKVSSAFPDRIVYQTPAWLAFLAETQQGEPVVAALREGHETLGYFTGLIVRKLGLKILGSPFRGWTCPYMGFNLLPSVPRRTAVEALPEFAFKELGCIHFEVVDSYLTVEDIAGLGLSHQMNSTYEVDLTQTEEAILGNMNSYRRRDIRRAEKHGVVIQEVQDAEFADEFSNQLKDVFAKQGLVPTFGVDRVRAVLKHLLPTGMLLLLRARDPQGHCIATGLYLGAGQAAFYWGGASWRQCQNLHPNEALQWYAMKYWKRRGMKSYNLVGTMDFKARFGGRQTAVPMISKSRNRLISLLRASAPRVLNAALKFRWKLETMGRKNPEVSGASPEP
jgi:hypothetical protein